MLIWLNTYFNDKQSNMVRKYEKLQVQVPQQGSLKSDAVLKCFLGFTLTFQEASWLARKIFSLRAAGSLVKAWQGEERICSSLPTSTIFAF